MLKGTKNMAEKSVKANVAVAPKKAAKKTISKIVSKEEKVMSSDMILEDAKKYKTEEKAEKTSTVKEKVEQKSSHFENRNDNRPHSNFAKKTSDNKQVKEEKIPERAEIVLPELEKFLEAGSHFGHKKSRWNPKMQEYVYAERNGVHIIDLIKTMKLLKTALKEIQHASDRGSILIVGTKGQAASTVKEMAEEVGAFYVNNRWPGGLFTNFEVIKKSLDKLMKMEESLAKGAQDLVKKEQLMLTREVSRLNNLYSGIKFMDKVPALVIVIDSRVEKNAIKEARVAGVPVVALLDTNCDPTLVDFPIPSNDDSIRSIKLFVDLFKQAIEGGRKATSLVALRRDYEARLDMWKKEFEAEEERVAMLKQEEIERLKEMKKGSNVVRVVSKK